VAFLDPQPTQRLLDAYAGGGLFALALAPLAGHVEAIEASPSACADFAWNARALSNVTLHTGATEAILATLPGPFDGIVVDPPRRGLGDGVVQALARLNPARLVYVSCDPATLARDAALLTAAGFVLRFVQPIDLFPQTYHVECVTLWER
jgi:23S rRNA (uracil1939-C5)-methyltransferase